MQETGGQTAQGPDSGKDGDRMRVDKGIAKSGRRLDRKGGTQRGRLI